MLNTHNIKNLEAFPYYWDRKAAVHVISFFENLITHVKGEWAGTKIHLESWQKEIFMELFGWKRKSDGTRMYRRAWVEIPRKNAKTTMIAGLGLYMQNADDEPGAEVYSAAANKEQANIIFEIATKMVEEEAALRTRVKVHKYALYAESTNSLFRSLSKESKTKHGLNSSCNLIDEVHAHPDDKLISVLEKGTGARRQPLTIEITTAGIRKKGTPGWERHQYAKNVADGIIEDETLFVKIFCADEDDDPFSEATWRKANPNYGISVKPDYILSAAKQAKNKPSSLNDFKMLHLNIWTGSEQAFVDPEKWNACNIREITDDLFTDNTVVMGLDLASVSDFTALVGVAKNGDIFDVFCRFWIPDETIEERGHMKNQIRQWIEAGHISTTPGNVTDYNFIKAEIDELMKKFNVIELPFDPYNSTQLSNDLQDAGAPMVEFRQGWVSMSPAVKETEKLILKTQLNHGGNPVLSWMCSNLVITNDAAGNCKPDKAKSADKIDGMVALFMAIARSIFKEDGTGGPSIYEQGLKDVTV